MGMFIRPRPFTGGNMSTKKEYIGLLILGIVCVAVGSVLASGEIANWSSDNNGTVRINRVSAGVNSVEADTFIGDVTGDVTGAVAATTITASSTLAVTGVATLTAAPKLTAVTAGGTATATMTNAPAITEETPIWINITVGTNDYVFAAWLKD